MNENKAIKVIIGVILADSLTGLAFNLHFSYYRIGLLLKIFILAYILTKYSIRLKDKSVFSVYTICCFYLATWVITSLLSYYKYPLFSFGNSLIVLSRYLLVFILFLVFFEHRDSPGFREKTREVIEFFFKWNSLLIFFGALFSIDLLSSYNPTGEDLNYTPRFGYKGLIYGQNEVAGIYILGVAYFFREVVKYGRLKKGLLFLTLGAAFLTGTKSAMAGAVLVAFYFLIRYKLRYVVYGFLPILFGVALFHKRIWILIEEKYLKFYLTFYQNFKFDIISFLFSGRQSYVEKNFKIVYNQWNPVNFMLGDAFLYSETDFLDLFFFFGFSGIIYLVLYTRVFFFRDRTYDQFAVYLVMMAIAFMAGHMIQSAAMPVFLLLFIFSNEFSESPAVRSEG